MIIIITISYYYYLMMRAARLRSWTAGVAAPANNSDDSRVEQQTDGEYDEDGALRMSLGRDRITHAPRCGVSVFTASQLRLLL